MILTGIQILGEFLEAHLKDNFNELKKKQKELNVKLPNFPKPIFMGSTKNVHSMKSKPGNKAGDNTLLIQFENAYISDHSFESIRFVANFKFYISTKSFIILSNISDVIMKLHNSPVHIEEHQNVFTEKGYVIPNVHIQRAKINNILNLNTVDKASTSDAYKYVINVSFDTLINWIPNLKL